MIVMYTAPSLAYAMETSSASIVNCAVSPCVTALAAKTPSASLSRYPEVDLPLSGLLL